MQLEFYVHKESNLDHLYKLCSKLDFESVCLPYKPNLMSNLEVAESLLKIKPDLDITLNFSLSSHYKKGENIKHEFSKFITNANILGIKKFLVISGEPKKSIDSLEILKDLPAIFINHNEFNCAYNPYLENLEIENQRLVSKLSTGNVSGVYLQIGTNLEKLKQGINFARKIDQKINLYGCLRYPICKL